VAYETVRRWTVKFGPPIARALRRRQNRPRDVWRLDGVVVKSAGGAFWLWRAVDQYGIVLDEILRSQRDSERQNGRC
jgi:putative transposase